VPRNGQPVLLKNYYGRGTAYLNTTQFDTGLMNIPYSQFLQNSGFDLIKTLLREAGAERAILCDDVRVEVDVRNIGRPVNC